MLFYVPVTIESKVIMAAEWQDLTIRTFQLSSMVNCNTLSNKTSTNTMTSKVTWLQEMKIDMWLQNLNVKFRMIIHVYIKYCQPLSWSGLTGFWFKEQFLLCMLPKVTSNI